MKNAKVANPTPESQADRQMAAITKETDEANRFKMCLTGPLNRLAPYSAANNSSAPSRSTLTSRETPRSTMVTPNRRCIRLIVTALWVTIR